jgi:hypothetical protein
MGNTMVRRKLSWFDQGAAELRACYERRGLVDELPEGAWYLCPCCPTLQDRESVLDGSLTAEDVPPKSVGGRKIVLTCEDCNNTAGHRLDHHLAGRWVIEDFINRTENGHRQRFIMHGPDGSVEGEGHWVNGGLQLYGLPGNSHPDDFKRFFASMDRASQEGAHEGQFSFSPKFPPVDNLRAHVSLIRAAYLTAFAVFGWPYILNERTETLRELFKNPAVSYPPLIVNQDVNGSNCTRTFLIANEPEDLACVAVTIGKRTIVLPSPFKLVNRELMTFEALAASFESYKRAQATINLRGKLVPWPTRAMYTLK